MSWPICRIETSKAVGEGGGRRLVQDAQHVEAGDAPGVLGLLPLAVVEEGGNRDDGLGHRLANVGLDDGAHLFEDHRADLGHRVDGVADGDAHGIVRSLDDGVRADGLRLLDLFGEVEATDEALRRVHRVLRVDDDALLARVADDDRAVVEERDDRRVRELAPLVRDDDGGAVFDDRHAAVARAEIDAHRDLFHRDSSRRAPPRVAGAARAGTGRFRAGARPCQPSWEPSRALPRFGTESDTAVAVPTRGPAGSRKPRGRVARFTRRRARACAR